MENESEINNIDDALGHQFGMLVVGTLAGFIASKTAHKAYKMAVEAYRAHKTASPEVN